MAALKKLPPFPKRIVVCPRCGLRIDADSDVLVFLGLGVILGFFFALTFFH